MNESLVKYLAGLLDADGSLSFWFTADRNRPGLSYIRLHLNLSSSVAVDKTDFVDSLPMLTGMGTVVYSGHSRQFKTWEVFKRADLEMLLPRLIKHMVIKARHWNWLLGQWRDLRTESKTVLEEKKDELKAASIKSRQECVGPLKAKNHPTWAWLAGYLDGDGTYHYRRHKGQWAMRVSAAAHVHDASVLEFIQGAFGGSIRQAESNVMIWTRFLGYQNRDFALRFLPNLAKHSRFKRPKIDALIHHHRQRLSVQGVKGLIRT
jgi:hypothetical protein